MGAVGGIAGIILAAGGSVRMGRAKQLLMLEGKTLLRRAAEAALAAGFGPVVVVLGDDPGDLMRHELADLRLVIVGNPQWRLGMGTSIRAGMQAVNPQAGLRRVALMLCDQPLVDGAVLRRLVNSFGGGEQALCAAGYKDTVGVPAIFGSAYFPELQSLPEDQGAKTILRRGSSHLKTVPMPEAAIDIDDPASYQKLLAGLAQDSAPMRHGSGGHHSGKNGTE